MKLFYEVDNGKMYVFGQVKYTDATDMDYIKKDIALKKNVSEKHVKVMTKEQLSVEAADFKQMELSDFI